MVSGSFSPGFHNVAVYLLFLGTCCCQLVNGRGGSVADVLAQGFSTDNQISSADNCIIRKIPFQSFNERKFYGVKYRMSKGDFTEFVHGLSSKFAVPKVTENSLLEVLYAEVNKEVVREIHFSKGFGYVTYGQVSILRHNDGWIDLAYTIHHVSFQIQPGMVRHEKSSGLSDWGHKTKYRGEPSLSDQEMTILLNYAKYKAINNFLRSPLATYTARRSAIIHNPNLLSGFMMVNNRLYLTSREWCTNES